MIPKLAVAALALGGVLACTGAATAESAAANTAATDPDAWRLQAAPYGWLIGVSGSTATVLKREVRP